MAGSAVGANTQSYQLLLTNFQTALLNNVTERCLLLTQLLQDSSLKELQYVFPALIENLFGFHSGVDWGLLSIEKDVHSKEFEALKKLMAPDGPILRLVYKFIEEFSPKFEFSVAYLPVPSQLMLQEGKVPLLYTNKLQIVNPGMFPSTLQLNAFEFFFFHFAYFIVNPSLKNSLSTVNQQDTLYAHLLEDYLFCYLPTDGRAVPLFQTPFNIQHSPIMTSSLSSNYGSHHTVCDSLHNKSFTRPDFLSPVCQKPSLLKKGTVLMVASSGSNSPCGFGSSQAESWKSETLILILKEIYLNQNSLDYQQNVLELITKTFVPSHYHVWMVRILVKHLHFFFNSSLTSNPSTGHGQIMIDSLGHLKSLGMTQLIQKEMYCFLKSTFDHWPLDASFRVPLETWLSYIQPWRYIQCDLDPSIWQKFITENVLFYTSILQQVLRRFLRVDLNCPKNAYMLYRLTKVFSLSDMREMVMQAEQGCLSKPSNMGLSNSYLSRRPPERSFSFYNASQLEMPGSSYVPLFSEPVFTMVTLLLQAINTARSKAQENDENRDNSNRSFIAKLYGFFDTSNDVYNSDDNSPSDIKKVASYLEFSYKQLCDFFQEVSNSTLNKPQCRNTTSIAGPSFSNGTEIGDKSNFHDLSAVDKFQILNKRKQPKVDYLGNPDLQPVRTYEVATLVKVLNEISQLLNDKYASEVQQLYYKNNIWGKICRRVLSKPTTYYNVVKSSNMQSIAWNPVHLPPRITLRLFAHKKLICYICAFIVISYYCGYNPITSIFFMWVIVIFYIILSALFSPVPMEIKQD